MSGWQNWSGAVQCPDAVLQRPQDVDGVRASVLGLGQGERLRVVGSGHSFVPFWAPGDRLLSLENLRGLEAVVDDVARIRAGTPIHTLGPLLAAHGRALLNQGDIDRQALAGAVATGTHGTGRGLGSLSSAVTAMELIDGTGTPRRIDDPHTLDAARVSMGMLGVTTHLEMRTRGLYGLHERSWMESPEATIDAFDARADAHRHHEFWWVPRGDISIAKTLSEIDVPDAARLDEIPFGESGERWGASWQVFPSAREARFNELEFSVPSENGLACFAELRGALLRAFPKLPWPIEYRILAGDTGWLSSTAGVEVAALSIHQDARRDPAPLFELAEPILRAHGGRPHWGKCHSLDRDAIAALYPRHEDFVACRRDHDPEDRFLTPWLAERFRAE